MLSKFVVAIFLYFLSKFSVFSIVFLEFLWYSCMFIKITKSDKYEYVSVVEAYRDKESGNTKHRVLFNLGRLDKIKDNPSFQKLLIDLETPSHIHLPYGSRASSKT